MAFPDEEKISERLEATKKLGLVSEYLLSWIGGPDDWSAQVTVWPNGASGENGLKDYMAKLLRGFVADRQIVIADN